MWLWLCVVFSLAQLGIACSASTFDAHVQNLVKATKKTKMTYGKDDERTKTRTRTRTMRCINMWDYENCSCTYVMSWYLQFDPIRSDLSSCTTPCGMISHDISMI